MYFTEIFTMKRLSGFRRYGNGWYGKNGKRASALRKLIILYGRNCKICNDFMEKPTIDHITPLSEGGQHIISNMQLLCESCHRTKDYDNNVKFGIIGGPKKKI